MTVQVLLFAVARELAGSARVEVALPEGATVGDLRRVLAERHPALASVLPAVVFSMENQYVDDAVVIPQGTCVACIPPVSGG